MPKLSALAVISLISSAGCAGQPQVWPVRVLPQEAPAVAAPTPDLSALDDDGAATPAVALAVAAPESSDSSDARIGPPRGSGAGSRRVKAEH